jgi:hypothetical protein
LEFPNRIPGLFSEFYCKQHWLNATRTLITEERRVAVESRIGVGQSFAKFREKFASGAAGAEISRNLPLTAPLASQAHAVHKHMYRISME